MTNKIPYGYEVKKGKICINEKHANEIRDMFNTYIKCNSYVETSKILGCKDKPIRIRHILLNPVYAGKEYWPAIIDKDTFNEVQNLRIQKAIKVGKVYEPSKLKEVKVTSTFTIGRISVKYDDPYQQAEYAYSQIKEIENE